MKGRILCFVIVVCSFLVAHADGADSLALRSEEHTSELQSH